MNDIAGLETDAEREGSRKALRPLADIIQELNERFGLGLGTSDRILIMQQAASVVEDPTMQQVALLASAFGEDSTQVRNLDKQVRRLESAGQ